LVTTPEPPAPIHRDRYFSAVVRALLVGLVLLIAPRPAGAVGFQWVTVPDPDDRPIEMAVWYPSDTPVSSQPIGLFKQDVAPYAPVAGRLLPLIVISHGTGGGGNGHYDIALALAEAGFVVAAPSHTGDNYKDHAYSFTRRNFVERSRQLSRVIDFMLKTWPGHDNLDPSRVGAFGHSAGGATILIALGATPDLDLAGKFCKDHPETWDCIQVKLVSTAPADPKDKTTPVWTHDKRIKAAVIAAPAIGYTFTKDGLSPIVAPIQMWRAEDDKITPNQWNSDVIEAGLPKPAEDHLVPQAGHFAFLAPCSPELATLAPEICMDAAGFDRAAFHQQMNKDVVAFFKTQLVTP
jgi:predicted dienelactone hydrolase